MIINELYGNSLEISDDMKIFLELFKNPIDLSEIKKTVEAEDIDNIVNELLRGGYLIDAEKPDYEQISPVNITNLKVQTICGSQPGRLIEDISSDKEIIGFIGIPYYRGSARFSGSSEDVQLIRKFSSKYSYLTLDEDGYTVGWYEPKYNKHVLKGKTIKDYGDLSMTNNQKLDISQIKRLSKEISEATILPIYIGGDHSISSPIIESLAEKYNELQVIQMDAHNDLGRQRWGVVEHGSFVTNILSNDYVKKIIQLGVRGPQHRIIEDPKLITKYNKDINGVLKFLDKGTPTYITIDCDVFDPTLVPEVSYPVPDGWTYNEFLKITGDLFKELNIVGIDVVEFNPKNGLSDVSLATISSLFLSILGLLGDF